MKREQSVLLILLVAVAAMIPIYLVEPMKKEADSFLKSMPNQLQDNQKNAILKALEGNGSDLLKVRNARDRSHDLPEGVEATYVTPKLRLYSPIVKEGKLPLLVYFHGGGWVLGSINSCARFCGALAAKGNVMVLAVDYRLAPDFPFPAGLDDCVEAVDYAVDNAAKWGSTPSLVSVGGDSSGGNLAIASALRYASMGRRINSLLLFYPVIYAYPDGSDSWANYGEGYALNSDLMEAFNRAYIGDGDARNPLISVGLADKALLSKLPKTLLVAAERDILCDQGERFIDTLQKNGVDAKRRILRGSVHLFITVSGQEHAFLKAVNLSDKFLSD